MNRSDPFTETVIDIILTTFLSLSSLMCLTTAFDMPFLPFMYVMIPSISLTFCALWAWDFGKRDRRPIVWITFLVLLGILLLLKGVNSLTYIWYVISDRYTMGYSYLNFLVPPYLDDFPYSPDVGVYLIPGLLIIGTISSFIISMSLRYLRRTLPAASVIIIGLAPCLILTDTIPDAFPLAMLAMSVITLVLSSRSRCAESAGYVKSVICSSVIGAILTISLLMACPFSDDFHIDVLDKKHLENMVRAQMEQIFSSGSTTGSVHLVLTGPLPNNRHTVMTIRTSHSGVMYLRGNAYSGFDGSRWNNLTTYRAAPSVILPTAAGHAKYFAEITTQSVEKTIYTPYYASSISPVARLTNDSYIENKSGNKFYNIMFNEADAPFYASDEYMSNLDNYDEWVRRNCLYVPEVTRRGVTEYLKKHTSENEYDLILGSSDKFQTANRIATLISQSAEYSRTTPFPAAGKDFCTWFLEDSDKGYCVHFATATCAALRAVGIPSRYATGYIATVSPDSLNVVTGMESHAWAEAWIAGRWVVVEATPSDSLTEISSLENNTADLITLPSEPTATSESLSASDASSSEDTSSSSASGEDADETVASSGENDSGSPDSTDSSKSSDSADSPDSADSAGESTATSDGSSGDGNSDNPGNIGGVPVPGQSNSSGIGGSSGAGGSGSGSDAGNSAVFAAIVSVLQTVLIVIAVASVPVIIIVIRRLVLITLMRNRLKNSDINTKARLMYRRIEKLQEFTRHPIPTSVRNVSRKAAFSRNGLTDTELEVIQNYLGRETQALDSAPTLKRLIYKYWNVII